MSATTIRRLNAGDRDRWVGLWQAYNVFYRRTVEDRVTRRLWGELLQPDREPYGFAAELDGQLVGFAHYFFVYSTSNWNPRCYMQDLFADPDIRGRGVGRRLIEAVYAEADRHEASQTYWLTQDFNETARRLYDRLAKPTPFVKYQR
ncbi:GNAT family N-acetyltransferase [Nitratireductor soli]|uniref:GNAT family N-acetyltransferase n=1 Tax=Nitratireductor soli TaxID=1670619 RepID=UPI00065DF911|nr:GNAT family N-acetyltransferase [Nitratireductor soli]